MTRMGKRNPKLPDYEKDDRVGKGFESRLLCWGCRRWFDAGVWFLTIRGRNYCDACTPTLESLD
jgi:hypothetical protein